MAHLTQMEFNYIRELIGPAMVGKAKFASYAQQANNQGIKQLFQQLSNDCEQKLSTFTTLLDE